MNLHSPHRPRIFHRPAFTSGHHVVPRLQVWPLDSDGERVELSLMLPVPDTRFSGAWKSTTVSVYDIPTLIYEFTISPEEFIKIHFGLDLADGNFSSLAEEQAASRESESPRQKLSVTELLKG